MRFCFSALFLALIVLPAAAQPWYARGEFNGYGTGNQLADLGAGHYSGTVSGLTANQSFEYKVANADFSTSAPPNNGKVTSNAAGEITFHLWDNTTWNDGWFPKDQRRVGYDDPLQYSWDLMGSFDGFTTGMPLTSQGNGLYSGQFAFNAGIHDFKFRKAGDWSVNYGKDFSNGSDNNTFRVWTTGDLWKFELDLPNGRWRASTTAPSPDRNGDEYADARDYVIWRDTDGSQAGYDVWRANYGYVPWYIRGSFNDFGLGNQMVDSGNGYYSGTITGKTPGTDFEYKIATYNYSQAYPGSNGKVRADANGEIRFRLYDQPSGGWTDSYSPANSNRVGYEDHNLFDWEVMGSFNGFTTGLALTDQGNGLHTGSFTFDAGMYEFKFRQQGDWNTNIGDNFGNGALNNPFVVATTGDIWNFELDLPRGRWRAYHPVVVGASTVIPEPTSIALVLVGVLFVAGATRRRSAGTVS